MEVTCTALPGEELLSCIQCVNASHEPVALALMRSAERSKEHAVYVCGAARLLHAVMPVLDTSVVRCEGTAITLEGLLCTLTTSQSSVFAFACTSPAPELADFNTKLQSALAIAKREHFNSGGASHAWIRFAASMPNKGEENVEADARAVPEGGAEESEAFIDSLLQRKAYEHTPRSMQSIRETWINSQLATRAVEFTKMRTVTVCIGTYNVNGKYPVEEDKSLMDLRPWLRFRPAESPDIYVLGFQELDLTAEAFIFNDSTREEDWSRAIEAAFHEGHNYRKLRSKQLVGMLLMVYVKAELLPSVRDVQADAQGTGILGMMGNKGGVAIRFKLHDSSVCFVNSHLAAHDDEVKRRNQDHHDICRRVLFDRDAADPYTIFDHDHLFWLGDLNYRIPLPDAEVKALGRRGPYDKLLEFDQLHEQQRLRAAFVDFEEGPITFPPTYKYDPGTNDFDSSEKMRTPAYCDRVMYYRGGKGKQKDSVVQQQYSSIMDCKVSDHKPVRALYLVQVKVVEPERYKEVYNSIVRQLDTIENKSLPDVTVSSNAFHFENVRYLRPQKLTVTVKNVGQVPAHFQFLPKPDQQETHKSWLWIEPLRDIVMPGCSKDVSLTVAVDDRSADALNTGKDTLEDILILHLENGKDLFITISGSYLRSSFCTGLDDLVCAPAPIRSLPPGPIERKPPSGPPDGVGRLHVPKELWLLVDYLYAHGMGTEGLFLTSGTRKNIWATIEALDTGRPIPEGVDVHSVAETLVRFLDALPEAVVPAHMYRRCIECSNSVVLCRQVISELPAVPQCVFIYLMAFLREVLHHAARLSVSAAGDDNRVTADKLSLIFGSLLLRPSHRAAGQRTHSVTTGSAAEALQSKKQAAFIRNFLVVTSEH